MVDTAYSVSFGGLLLMIWDYLRYLGRRWKIIFLIAILAALIGYFLAKKSQTLYTADLTFMLTEQEAPSSSINSVLGNLGIDPAGGGEQNLSKILELSRSMQIMQKVLLTQDSIDGKRDYFANHVIDHFKLHQKWNKNSLKDFRFQKTDFSNFDETEKEALKKVYSYVVGSKTKDGIFTYALSNDSKIMTLSLESPSQDLSVNMLLLIFEELSTYYIDKTTEKQQTTYAAIKAETDSIQQKLKSTEYQLARFRDTRQDLVRQKSQLAKNQLIREVSLYASIYAESIKNLELAKFNLKQKTPFIQAIDLPFKPLQASKSSPLKSAILAAIAGIFLSVILLMCYKIITDAVIKERQSNS